MLKRKGAEFIIRDTEYVMDKGQNEPGYNGAKHMEVIQIAALKVNKKLKITASFNVYVKTKFHPTIAPYFQKLTKITNQKIKTEGIDFPVAYEKFKEFAGNLPAYSHGRGGKESDICDGAVLNATMKYHNMHDDNPPNYKNIAEFFAKEYKEHNMNIKTQTSGEIACIIGCTPEIEHIGLDIHNALYDVYSILLGLRHFGFSI